MHFLDEIMFHFGKFFNSFALLAQLVQKAVLLHGNTAHPPKTNPPANGASQGHPKGEFAFHSQQCRQSSKSRVKRASIGAVLLRFSFSTFFLLEPKYHPKKYR